MSATVIKIVYLGLLVAIVATVMYIATAVGLSLWLAAVLAFAIFFFVNGSLAYVSRARQLRGQGEQPPRFLVYLFYPRPFSSAVAMPRALRVLLGVVILAGGGLFVITGGLILTNLDFSRIPRPIGAVAMLLVLAILGLAFAYVGYRLIIIKNEDSLFKWIKSGKAKSSQNNAA